MDEDNEDSYSISSEYVYSDCDESDSNISDDDISLASAPASDTVSLEMEDADAEDRKPSSAMAATAKVAHAGGSQKRKSRSMSSSGTGMYDCIMRDKESSIQMMDSKDIVPIMKRRINEISEVLNIPPSAACPLLRNHKWAKERLLEAFTEDDEKVQAQAGVHARCTSSFKTASKPTTTSPSSSTQNTKKCAICFDDELNPSEMLSMPCGHEFCIDCWGGFITAKLSDGPSCILMTCPQAGCNELVTEEEVCTIATPEELQTFETYQLRHFVEWNKTCRWCPGPGCERVAALPSNSNGIYSDSDAVIALCDACHTQFCLKCGEEPHAPLKCAALETWKEKCKNESETANWILANTKACPKCRSRIEKNQGCNHMTCQKCKHEFCWICSGDWKDHGANTGGYYNCNKFNAGGDTDDGSDAAKAKRELDRYLHYYSRYHAHAEAQKFAKRQLHETEKRMVLLQEARDNSTWADVEFLKTANEQLVECRRVLKFTYTFAYYLTMPSKNGPKKDENDVIMANANGAGGSKKKKDAKRKEAASADANGDSNANGDETAQVVDPMEEMKAMQKVRFEHHQEMLERFTENLSELVEKPLNKIDRVSVVNQTRVVDRFMKNMLQYVEDGMEEN